MISQNTALGFDQMRAAIVGGHDISDAFAELLEMTATAKDMSIVQGGFACLLACILLLERQTSIADVPSVSPIAEFLAMGPQERAEHVDQLLIGNSRTEVASLAAHLICILKPMTALYVFKGRLGQELSIELRTE